MYGENKILKDLRVLTADFIPSRIVHRDGQLKSMRDDLKPILKGTTPRNVFVYGPPGTGKTCMSRYLAEELRSYSSSVAYSYINCWESGSRFKILYTILQDLGLVMSVHRKGTPTDELSDTLKNKLKERYCVVILDEVDQLEDFRVLYDLVSVPKICTILITNRETALHRADPRVRSRLASADNVDFMPYDTREISDILKDRAEWGLVPGVIKNSQLESIAEFAEGDARVAIDILRIVAEDAENNDLKSIPDSYIRKALPQAKEIDVNKNLEKLNTHQRLLLDIIEKNGKLDAKTLVSEFQKSLSRNKLEKISERSFRNYMDILAKQGFINASGTGRWRSYSRID